jgi:hypothetical protein
MMSRRFLGTLALFAVAALPALAKPNFTGDWKMNVSKSDFGQMPAPDSVTYKVKHDDPKLANDTKQSGQFEMEQHLNYTTDGKESTNEGFQGSTMKSVAKWDGDILVIESKAQFGDNPVTITQKWSLSADGKNLTVVQAFKADQFEGESKMVFDKQ